MNKYNRKEITTELKEQLKNQVIKYGDILNTWLYPNDKGVTKVVYESTVICKAMSLNERYLAYYVDEWADDVFLYEIFLNYDSSKGNFSTFFRTVTKKKILNMVEYYNGKNRKQMCVNKLSIDVPFRQDQMQTLRDIIQDPKDYEAEVINNMYDNTDNTFNSFVNSLSDYARVLFTYKVLDGLKKANILLLMGITETEYLRYWQEIKRKTRQYY